MPDFILQGIRQASQRLLVQRSLAKQFAQSLGFQIGDLELADLIMKEKDFDPVAYKNFLQYFFRQNGFGYEDLVREDLLIQKFQDWTQKIAPAPTELLHQIQWTFDTLTLKGVGQKEVAFQIQQAWAKGDTAPVLVKKTGGKVAKIGPIGFSQRQRLFSGQLTDEEYLQLFSLLKPNAAPVQPFIKADQFLLVRLVSIQGLEPSPKNPFPWQAEVSLVDAWFQHFGEATKVESFISSDNL